MDMKTEVVLEPMSDADRARGFSATLGWRLATDCAGEADVRVVQPTPPWSACTLHNQVAQAPT